ncbi:hypothetical protein CUJ84_pRLN2000306 (plasmid) [Rhizobium leguminosarum]|uniref:Uncharacterized protein n=1 Tax=Rhizobium leguminosarum TaxID=384 RepID=A0A2K9ZF32_RHILE|nr:hypothetical protein CUJ84_pRLN2000306 [Rhizobium leguminosarum]
MRTLASQAPLVAAILDNLKRLGLGATDTLPKTEDPEHLMVPSGSKSREYT